jgi:putative cardiolipin synthase
MRCLLRTWVSVVLVALGGCASLPPQVARVPSSAYTDTADTGLARALAPQVAAHPGQSGVYALPSGQEAFGARMALARTAQRSIDAQYYIWHDDITGTMLFGALWEAAERGVRVRLLIDDNNTRGLDATLAMLDAQPIVAPARLRQRLRAPEPAHAQQVVHGRQPGHHRRRPQHRR